MLSIQSIHMLQEFGNFCSVHTQHGIFSKNSIAFQQSMIKYPIHQCSSYKIMYTIIMTL